MSLPDWLIARFLGRGGGGGLEKKSEDVLPRVILIFLSTTATSFFLIRGLNTRGENGSGIPAGYQIQIV
jgi:hypothetical protein